MAFYDESPYSPYYQHRAIVSGKNGAVAGASPQAAIAGLRVLQNGGNAVDAAIAIAGVENVTLPMACGLGGEVFCMVHTPDGRNVALNSSGVAPFAASAESFRKRGLSVMPVEGAETAAVPGAVAAYERLLLDFGTMPLAELLKPAIDYAEKGFPIGQVTAVQIADFSPKLSRYPTSAATYLGGGAAPKAGSWFVQPNLARSLRIVAEGGTGAFYHGELTSRIVKAFQEGGAPMTEKEFAEHEVSVYEPLRTTYRGYDILQTAPPSQGLIVLEELNILEGWDVSQNGPLSARTVHLMVEAKRLAYADRLRYMGDPRFVHNPTDQLISKDFAAARRSLVSESVAMSNPVEGGQVYDHAGSTTSFVVADGDGMLVTFIHSLSALGGSGLVAGDTGILLNNRVGRGFTLEEGHPNELAGGKKTMHTLNCYQIHRDGKPLFIGGTPGGDGQPQWNFQVIADLLDFDMNVQQAAEWPRWSHLPGTDPATFSQPWRLELDGRYPESLASELAALGHNVVRLDPWQPGASNSGVQLIRIDPETGVLEAGSDPRTGGMALAY